MILSRKVSVCYGPSIYRAQGALHVSYAVRAPTRYTCGRGASLLTTFPELEPLCRSAISMIKLFCRDGLPALETLPNDSCDALLAQEQSTETFLGLK